MQSAVKLSSVTSRFVACLTAFSLLEIAENLAILVAIQGTPAFLGIGWGTVIQPGKSWVRSQMMQFNLLNLPNPSSRTIALGLAQPLTERGPGILLGGGKARPTLKDENLTAICEPIVYKTWDPRRLTLLRPSKTCYSDSDSSTFYLNFLLDCRDM
jgi:hypothetical protein